MKKRQVWAALALWDQCRKQAAKLGLTIAVDHDPNWPLVVLRDGTAEEDWVFRVARVRELSDYLDGYEHGQEDRS